MFNKPLEDGIIAGEEQIQPEHRQETLGAVNDSFKKETPRIGNMFDVPPQFSPSEIDRQNLSGTRESLNMTSPSLI
jgi:hypothetical protein